MSIINQQESTNSQEKEEKKELCHVIGVVVANFVPYETIRFELLLYLISNNRA